MSEPAAPQPETLADLTNDFLTDILVTFLFWYDRSLDPQNQDDMSKVKDAARSFVDERQY